MPEPELRIELVYALPASCLRVTLRLPPGATVADAIDASGWRDRLPPGAVDDGRLAVFGRKVTPATPLADGDRIELLRPLQCDPKEVRRQRAARAG